MQAQVPTAVAAESDDRDRPARNAGVGKELPQQPVHAVGVALERGATTLAARGVGAQFILRGVKRRPDRGASARLRHRHGANIFGCRCERHVSLERRGRS